MATAISRSAPAPTPQEIQRKLSTSRPSKPPAPISTFSGAESDSDSVFSPDAPASAISMSLSSGTFFSPTAQAPLSAIVERRTASGEETDEDDDEEEGWRVATTKNGGNGKDGGQGGQVEIRKAGYLWKKGIRRKTWKKRWFVLRISHLAYYKSSAEYKLLRLLDLHEVHAVTTCALKRHEHTFGIVTPNRTFYLQAENEAELLDWVQALNDVRLALQSTASVISVPTTPGAASPPIAIPPPTTPRARAGSTSRQSPLTPSPPARLHMQNVTSSDSENEPSPTAMHAATTGAGSKAATISQAAQDPTKPVLSGYLMKCSQKRRNWRKRWFTLTGEKLVYTTSHMDTRPHRVIQLTQIVDALEVDVPFPGAKHGAYSPPPASVSPSGPSVHGFGFPQTQEEGDGASAHTFKVITPKRTLLLCAPSEEEEIQWMSAIRALIARRSGVSGPAPGEATVRKTGRRLSAGLAGVSEGGSGGGMA
ncbi:PH domain-like protein [Exidia glandulosa HHB12029]|uniref:PH domain-like protein n=1 Tax=Exidia glandulosa HHB12029 TaxID=1314781 RepID=A0A165PZY7_EXIGL|nr:PH domain-like protein [Exidia glandulosa HHB12029]